MQIHKSKDIDQLSQDFAHFLIDYANQKIAINGAFSVALSGGSTPKKLHLLLASDDFKDKTDWSKWHFFMGDERFVPFSDDRSNAKMCYETLLDRVPVNKNQIHFYQTENIEPAESALQYEKLLRGFYEGKQTGIDLVILGMGDDGHTLSLFPGQPIIHETKKWVDSFWLEAQDMYRITMTHPIANHAGAVAFLVAGAGKSKALKAVLEGAYEPDIYPSQIISPTSGELHWFIDEAAGGLL
ncbi:6-phosphogluconolactonase [Arachidicoccus ginsenosidivorans]|jgi:6-phosphogluconolactonase|uniref:6-phosphogluconolactonase n=1 Tax=Arachidicoccus ginsenosidivorans TaxID=496057 RepID=A0A5B8VP57_9BACT|nr:6-phosphogluconolactonase [Arachidicoccus ginsenosidivorans]QEC73407.1 6-phosphogluconolactonase [Arachidicoccus ginsenosidivorans]